MDTIKIYADADAAVDSGDPDDNDSTRASMNMGVWEGRVHYCYIRFPVGAVPDRSYIRSACLRLRTLTPPDELSAEFRRVYETWGERTITWNNQPATTPENMHTHLIGRDECYDITDIFLDALAAGGAFSVGIAAVSGTVRNSISFYTREASLVRRPYIEIEWAHPLFQYQLIFDAAELLDQERKDLLAAEYAKYEAISSWHVIHSDPDCFDTIRPNLPGGDGISRTGWLCHGIEFGQSPCYPVPWWACGRPTPAVQYFRGECSCDHFKDMLQPLGIPCYHLIKAREWYGSTVPHCPYIQCP